MRPLGVLLVALVACRPVVAAEVGKWQRFSLSIDNPTWKGNPFEVVLACEFESATGRKLTQWGFYAGGDSWSVYFMPDELGRWSYVTASPDPELDGKKGSFRCVPSGLPGMLRGRGNRWELSDRGVDFPAMWNPPVRDGAHWGFRERDLSHASVQEALDFADKAVRARVIGFYELLIIPTAWASDWPQDAVPYVKGKEGEAFHLPFWNRLNAKLDAVRDRGMGHYIMFYSDDELTPDNFGFKPRSEREVLFFRYAVARLACYPIVIWDTGIDIGEYRDRQWIEWFVSWFAANDPWRHPVGSRTGGGSGGFMPKGATCFSVGGAGLPGRAELIGNLKRPVPTAHTDHWRPFISRGGWTNERIRTVVWRCALSAGQSPYPDYNQGKVDYRSVLKAGPWIGHAVRFLREELRGDFGALSPRDDLIKAGDNAVLAAAPGSEYVLYDEDGGSVSVDLSAVQGEARARWYNPRTGSLSEESAVKGGAVRSFASPTAGGGSDWVLHVYTQSSAKPGRTRAEN